MHDFDPYYIWLGIAPDEQPPNHYRLLGLRTLEDNPEVIREAAFRQMAHVRTYQLGPHQETSQRILNELAAARACLLDSKRKLAYDQGLRAALEPGLPSGPPPMPPPLHPKARRRWPWAAAISCFVVAVAGFVVLWPGLRPPTKDRSGDVEPPRMATPPAPRYSLLVLAWPEQERANATLFLDGQSVDVPPLGPVELRCQAGDRVIEAVRPGFERYRKSLHVDEGQKVGVDLSWTRAPAPKIAQAKSSDVREQNQIVELPKAQTPAPIQQSAIDAAREPQQKETAPNSPAETAVSYGLVAFQWPEQERSNAALFFDGQQFALSTSGPLEFQRPLGTCLVEATRPGYERFARQITVMSGRTVNVEFAWKPVARNSIDFSGLWRSSTGKQYELVDDGSVIHVKLVDASGDYLSGRLIRHGRDELRSTVWEATFANDRLRRRWNLRTELTVVSSKELRGRYETVFWGASPGTVVRRFPNHCTWKKVE